MTTNTNLPPELATLLMSLLKEVNGEFIITDMPALVKLVQEHGQQYPELFDLVKIDEDALLKSFHETGTVPPGIKITHTSTEEGSNVTELKVFHGPRSIKS